MHMLFSVHTGYLNGTIANPLYIADFLLGCDDIRTVPADGRGKLVVVSTSCTLNENPPKSNENKSN